MKTLLKTLILSISLFALSCEECEINTLTDNQSSQRCRGLLMITEIDNSQAILDLTFRLDSLASPLPQSLLFNPLRQDQAQLFYMPNVRPSGFTTYDAVNQVYYVSHYMQQRMYKYDIVNNTRTELGGRVAPVFANGKLYAINRSAINVFEYYIEEINQTSGINTTLFTGTFTNNNNFMLESMSSTFDGQNHLYFMSGTHLIKYNITTNTAEHFDLQVGEDFLRFDGLEYRNNGKLLAIEQTDNTNRVVEIDPNNPLATRITLIDMFQSGVGMNQDFYATTYNPCNDHYYITIKYDEEPQYKSYLFEVNLSNGNVVREKLNNYVHGVQVKY